MKTLKVVVINKTCKCGKQHSWVPHNAREWFDDGVLIGWVWECQCKSSLFVPTYDLKKQMQERAS